MSKLTTFIGTLIGIGITKIYPQITLVESILIGLSITLLFTHYGFFIVYMTIIFTYPLTMMTDTLFHNVINLFVGVNFIRYVFMLFDEYDNNMFVINDIKKNYLEHDLNKLKEFDNKFESLPYIFTK